MLALLVLPTGSPLLLWADDGEMSNAQIRQQIKLVKEQVEQQNLQLGQFHERAKLLERRVECNWVLLRGYEECEEHNDKSSAVYVKCLTDSKLAFKECESEITGQ